MSASYLDNPGNQLFRQATRLGLQDSQFTSLIHGNLASFEDIVGTVRLEGARNIARLIGAIVEVSRPEALSYRDFRVGAAAFAAFFDTDSAAPWCFMLSHGANVKPVEGSDIINVHAEHEIMIKATESAGPNRSVNIPIMMIIGDLQPDQQTGLETPTLHPCGVCRKAFKEHSSPVTKDTLIVTANPELTTFEWFSVQALDAFHATGKWQPGTSGMAQFDNTPLSLKPTLPDPITGRIDLSQFESDDYINSDHLVSQKLIQPLMLHAASMKPLN